MEEDGDKNVSPGPSRARRQKFDRHGRSAAFEKLKHLKGTKNKVQVNNVENVYEEVDEKEYNKRVLERQYDDWIVDEGSGYVEDGREIFDDDLDDESISTASKKKREPGRKRKSGQERESTEEEGSKGGNIRHMLINMQTKKKKVETVKLEEDDAFGDILQELDSKPTIPLPVKIAKYSSSATNGSLKTGTVPYTAFSSKTVPKASKPAMIDPSIQTKQTPEVVDSVSIKEEPLDSAPQIIEDCNSMDYDFSNQDFEEIDMVESQLVVESSQAIPVVIKKEIKVEEPLKNAENSWGSLTKNLESSSQSEGATITNTTTPEIVLADGVLPMAVNESGEEVLRMFWWDAYEDPFKQPGVVYLFGKVQLGKEEENGKTWASICLIVRNIERHIFLLPRPYFVVGGLEQEDRPISLTDVYSEFNSKVAQKHKVMEFKSRPVTRNYAFNLPGVPVEADYLEVVYPGSGPILPQDLSGETFSRVFGTNTSSLESLLLQRRLKGPCWLDIKGAKRAGNPISWCKLEALVQDPDAISVYTGKLAPPPLVAMTISLRIAVNPKTLHNEIVMASCLISPRLPVDQPPPQPAFDSHFCIVCRPSDSPWPMDYNIALGKSSNFNATLLHRVDTERALLSLLLTKLFRADPDLLLGHDIANFDLPTLLFRLGHLKVDNWSRLGRLKRSGPLSGQMGKSYQTRTAVCGRLVCDVKLSAQELIRARSYDLDTLCQVVLRLGEGERTTLSVEDVRNGFSSGAMLRNLVCLSMQDAAYILRMMCELNALPLALQITNIAGNVMSRTLMGGRSERNEFLLLHAFDERGYIVPDKMYGKKVAAADIDEDGEEGGGGGKAGRRKKAAYAGGLVLDPKKGFYDSFILLMDFNSLYPSIIQEYNICFTTLLQNNNKKMVKNVTEEEEDDGGLEEMLASIAAAQNSSPGVLPTEIRKLVESRRLVKGLLAKGNQSAEEKMQLNIRQMALKLTANSMYGCLGFSHSRFYAKHLAALVTYKGRDILMNTKGLVERMGLDVVYGDTDSIMINTRSTNYDEVLKLGFKIKGEVNKLYHQVELEVDGIFKYLLLLKKKKYAALTISRLPDGTYRTEQELKGLDIVRRDWAPLAADTGKFVLQLVLGDLGADERIAQLHEHLSKLRGMLERGEVPLAQLAIAKTLSRPPEQYSDKKGLPQVSVALRLNSKGGRKLKQGDTVHYIICDDGSVLPATQRAYHIDEVKANPHLKVDVEYYLAQQIHPVVSRLVESLDGTDAVIVAECLGLDTASYKHAIKREENEEEGYKQISQFALSEEERFKHCDAFKFKCQSVTCGVEIEMKSALIEGTKHATLEKCKNPTCSAVPLESLPHIQNCLSLSIRNCISRYYEGWLVCEDPRCNSRTRGLGNNFSKGMPMCRKCKQGILVAEYSEHDLHQQIYFYRHMFNIAKYPIKWKLAQETEVAYQKLQEQAMKSINLSSFCLVDLTSLFKKLQTKKISNHPSIL